MKRKAFTVLGVLAATLAMTACNNNVRKDSCGLNCACGDKSACSDDGSCCGTCGGDKKSSCCGTCGGDAKGECCGTCGGEGHKHDHGDHDHS